MYRFLVTLTATAAILTTASLLPNSAAASPAVTRADIAKTYKQTDGANGQGLDQCQFRGEYGQELRERIERLRRERAERRERLEHERAERRERLERERAERRERLERERRERREHR